MISKSIILLILAVTSVAATSPITTMLTVVSAQTSGNNVIGNTGRPANQQFLNLANTTWTLYNETSGSTSIMKFNSDGTYTRNLHDNNLTGNWQSSIVTEQQVQLCPTEPKWTSGCILVGLRIENPHSIGFMDSHGDRMHLMR
jgi:hypothetical protein